MPRYLGLISLCILWELSARTMGSPLFVAPTNVGPALWALRYDLIVDTIMSLRTLLAGFVAAVAIGVGFGLFLAKVKPVHVAAMPVIETVRSISALAIFPLLILLLGLGVTAKAFVIFWTAWPAILINTMHGILTVDGCIVEAATLDGADGGSLLRLIQLPLAMPTIAAGLRIGASGGWIGLTAAEMLGSNAGLGFAVLSYSQSFQFPAMYAAIVCIAATGLIVNSSLAHLQTYVERKF